MGSIIDKDIQPCYQMQKYVWHNILHCFLAILLYLGERCLVLKDAGEKVNSPCNRNFLYLPERLAKDDRMLQDHVEDIKLVL